MYDTCGEKEIEGLKRSITVKCDNSYLKHIIRHYFLH